MKLQAMKPEGLSSRCLQLTVPDIWQEVNKVTCSLSYLLIFCPVTKEI